MADPIASLFEEVAANQQAPQAPPPEALPQQGEPAAQAPQVNITDLLPPIDQEKAKGFYDSYVAPVLNDIGTGITELPRAVARGGAGLVQETLQTSSDAVNWALGNDAKKIPTNPVTANVDAPQSVTGKLSEGVSQFVLGMIGLGKLTKPVEAIVGAGKGANFALSSTKAATVGAVGFDPEAARMSNLVEDHLPSLSNPLTQYLRASPTDSRAEGRLKNAIESIGLDVTLGATLMAGSKVFRVLSEYRAGNATHADLQKAVNEAEAVVTAKEKPVEVGTESPAPKDPAATPKDPEAPSSALEPVKTEQATSVTASAPPEGVTAKPKLTDISEEQMGIILKGLSEDEAALARAGGSFEGAIAEGHNFGTGRRIPWQLMASEVDGPTSNGVEAFVARMADTLQAETNKARGGGPEGVMSDATINQMVSKRAAAWGEDPSALMGLLTQAGKDSKSLAANMNAAFLLGQRAVADTRALALRIQAGDFSHWGGDEAAAAKELLDMLKVTQTLFDSGNAMRAAAGRAMRRSRAEYAPNFAAIDRLEGLDANRLAAIVEGISADPRIMRKALNAGFLDRAMDWGQWLLVNNLLWGWRTHFVNFSGNAFMAFERPAERILGSFAVAGEAGQRMRAEGWRQYVEMGHSLMDSLEAAAQTWRTGDSVLTPHTLMEGRPQAIDSASFQFKPFDSLQNLAYNAVVGMGKTVGLPTRALGSADELFKQITYRSYVASKAHVAGAEAGLTGAELTAHVQDTLLKAFDDAGRAIDAGAIQEARTTTFNQPLLDGTLGKSVQAFGSNHKWFSFIVPFVQTPTNVIRYGVKMTPALNLLQKQYREMITGVHGAEAQAQAVGQMATGSLILATAAYLKGSGLVTGGGPTDPKARKALTDTGWQPYSFVKQNPDGTKTYTNYGRYDPVAMPLGLVADLGDIANAVGQEDGSLADKVSSASTAVLLGLVKQLQQKTYLRSIADAVRAISDPGQDGERLAGAARQQAVNFVPLSSLLRSVNTDPYMREARDLVDALMAQTPGLSDKLPPKRDAFGDPVHVHKGLWVNSSADVVDKEIERMVLASGHSLAPPNPNIDGVDLREVTLKDGRNAYDAYQTLAAKPSPRGASLKEAVGKIMASEAYSRAPDGEADNHFTKLGMVADVARKYRSSALSVIKADPKVREALGASNQKVYDHYKAQNAAKTKANELKALGDAFGVNLTPGSQ